MASQFNITVEDSSPLITYFPAGSWIDTPTNDQLASSYSGSSYHTTNAQGATATIAFNGTGVWIFGGHRPNYGTYSIMVDGQTVVSGSSQANNASGNQLLGSASGLPYGFHTAILTNTGGAPIDIDWIDFETQVEGPETGTMSVQTIDNTDPSIVYSPAAAWGLNTNANFLNETLSFTQTPDASASLTFSGGAIAVYGTVSPDHANIVITIDGQQQTMQGGANGFSDQVHPKTLLYYQTGLSANTSHTFSLSGNSQAPGTGPFVDLDMINVFAVSLSNDGTAPSIVSPPNESIATPSTSPFSSASGTSIAAETPATAAPTFPLTATSSSRISTGTIVGATLGGFFLLLLVSGIIAYLFLRQRRNHSSKIEKSMISVSPILPMQRGPKTPILPMQTVTRDLEAGGMRTAFSFPIPSQKAADTRHSIAPSYYSSPTVYSRDSEESSSPLVPNVPMIIVPQPRSNIARKPAPPSSELAYYDTPARPSTRPPPMDFAQMENPRRY
ncbi:hypothetical protein BDN70DRAFT_879533 [Pholiota conissans]|uniref:Transmembrane protein n=1 Tax=Pholiota conissans TaxID=109636 RepID=A0A9P5Z2X2_9AGAR|nr:hypothetical protein BDN70DRAFT_879533 [Pholiota conissans]